MRCKLYKYHSWLVMTINRGFFISRDLIKRLYINFALLKVYCWTKKNYKQNLVKYWSYKAICNRRCFVAGAGSQVQGSKRAISIQRNLGCVKYFYVFHNVHFLLFMRNYEQYVCKCVNLRNVKFRKWYFMNMITTLWTWMLVDWTLHNTAFNR